MTDEELNEIEGMHGKTTKGEWYVTGPLSEEEAGTVGGERPGIVVVNSPDDPDDNGIRLDLFDDGLQLGDAEFIVAMKEKAPAMVAEVRRLRKQVETLKKLNVTVTPANA